jgi:hypothetical protein
MAANNLNIAAIALLLLSASALGGLAYTLSAEKDALSSSLERSNVLNANLSAAVADLSARITVLSSQRDGLAAQAAQVTAERDAARQQVEDANARIVSLNQTVSQQTGRIGSLVSDINATRKSLDDFERQINESVAWFSNNSNISAVRQFREMQNQLDTFCIEVRGDTCRIKLSCPRLVNDAYSQFEYKTDQSLYGKADKLQSLQEFADRRGGDCEDYSLAVKAELNFLVQKCLGRGFQKIEFEPVEEAQGQRYIVEEDRYSDPPVTWYYDNAKGVQLPLAYSNYHVVCGTFAVGTTANGTLVLGGHCLLGFSKVRVSNSSDIYPAISDSYFVEPQNGYLVDTTGYVKPQAGQALPSDFRSTSASIWAVITGDDFYIYSQQDDGSWRWRGYKDIYGNTETIRQQLSQIVSG